MRDYNKREIDYLRISITEECNYKCIYCIPQESQRSISKRQGLTSGEIIEICRLLSKLGVKRVKITGGEPLLRSDITYIIRQIKAIEGIEEVTLTTNGLLLKKYLQPLIDAGVDAINVSLDSLDRQEYYKITKVDALEQVLEGIKLASKSNLKYVKVNCIILKGMNDSQIIKLAELARNNPIIVRYIELMPIGMGRRFQGLTTQEIINILQKEFGEIVYSNEVLGNGPAEYWEISGFKGKIGFISALTECFCERCNRIRLTSSGYLKLCLYSSKGIDVKELMNQSYSKEELEQILRQVIAQKPQRHHFGESLIQDEDAENKYMSQIGG